MTAMQAPDADSTVLRDDPVVQHIAATVRAGRTKLSDITGPHGEPTTRFVAVCNHAYRQRGGTWDGDPNGQTIARTILDVLRGPEPHYVVTVDEPWLRYGYAQTYSARLLNVDELQMRVRTIVATVMQYDVQWDIDVTTHGDGYGTGVGWATDNANGATLLTFHFRAGAP